MKDEKIHSNLIFILQPSYFILLNMSPLWGSNFLAILFPRFVPTALHRGLNHAAPSELVYLQPNVRFMTIYSATEPSYKHIAPSELVYLQLRVFFRNVS